ncbi:MAG: carbohydrate kinase family protein [Promethearchaeota archaeon]
MRDVEVVGLGEVVVDWVARVGHFPEPDEKIDATSENLYPGGVTANYVTAVARLGGKAAFIGAVGNDEHGRFLLADFEAEGVDASGVRVVDGGKTPVNFIFVVERSGEKVIVQSPHMQTTRLSPDDLDVELVASAKVLHVTAIHQDVAERAVGIARDAGVAVTFDLEGQIASRGWSALKELVTRVDVLQPNKGGAFALAKTNDPVAAADFFHERGVPMVVITLGSRGCLVSTPGEKVEVPGFPVEAVDTTGAGDTFTAAFDWGVQVRGWDPFKAAKFANGAAALKCLVEGARTGMPGEQAVWEFLKEREQAS